MSAFDGFPPELFRFFEGLAEHNSKSYWQANASTWQHHVRGPMLALVEELADEFGALRMYRPNRDLRFTQDRSPYKLWAGATSESRAVGGVGYDLRVSATGLAVGCGAMALARDQLHRFRAALGEDDAGREFEHVLATLDERSLPVTPGAEPPLKTTPRGYPATHPRIDLLRWRGAAVVQEDDRADWMHRPAVVDRVRDIWRGAQPLMTWLGTNVGPSDEPTRRPSAAQPAT